MISLKRGALVAIAAIAAATFAAPASTEQIPSVCTDAPQMTMHICTDKLLRAANAEMEKLLGELIQETEEDTRKYVTDAHKAWTDYRDKECLSRIGGDPSRGGTIWPTLNLKCNLGLTLSRIEDLKEQVACPGGRLSC